MTSDDRAARRRARHLAVDHLGDRRDGVAPHVVGRAALDGGEQRRPEPPQVRGGRHGLARRDLRRDVGGGAEHEPGRRHRGVGHVAGDAEVGELHLAVVGDQHVARLDVAVRDPGPVRRAQRRRGREPDHRRLPGRQHPLLGDQRRQVPRRHHLQHDHRLAAGVDDVVHGDHVRVREPAQRAGLPEHALAHRERLALRHARRDLELLHRHPAAQDLVVARPDGAHRAAAQLRRQPVAPADQALLVVPRMHCAIVEKRHAPRSADPRTAVLTRAAMDARPRCIRAPWMALFSGWAAPGRGSEEQDPANDAGTTCDERRRIPPVVRSDRSPPATPPARSRSTTPERASRLRGRFGLVHRRPGEEYGWMHREETKGGGVR